jgi:predicted AAA+ superfamily ATPase
VIFLERPWLTRLQKHVQGSVNLLQIVVGPRQVGKTTAVLHLQKKWRGPTFYASADLPSPPDAHWIQSQWQVARQESSEKRKKTLLVLDEVQKVHRWSEVVKACYDEDKRTGNRVRAILLGSSALHVKKGTHESLAGRFELHFCPHWTWPDCQKAFRWSLDQWIYYGGYPGAAPLAKTPERWTEMVSNALVESILSRDVLQLTTVVKPALLRQLFMMATQFPAQIMSFNKMLGQLQDAGNTVTLAHYLNLLSSAYVVSGLNQWHGGTLRLRASSPKFILWNNALVNAYSPFHYRDARRRMDWWGRLVENAVGSHLLNHLRPQSVFYWRDGDYEVDYVIENGPKTLALEVKSGRTRSAKGHSLFQRQYPRVKTFVVGSGGVPLETFFSKPPSVWI